MDVQIVDRDEFGARGAELLAGMLRDAIDGRGVASLGVSGGSTPGPVFAALAEHDLDWSRVHVFQVDERVAPDGHGDRNVEALRSLLLDEVDVPESQVHPMPVADHDTPEQAAAAYADTIAAVVGPQGIFDVLHLGIGDDGHTASLIPGDAVVDVDDRLVAATPPFNGRRRVTLTAPVIRAARHQLWLIAGRSKAGPVQRMVARTGDDPAVAVVTDRATVLVDRQAAEGLDTA